MGIIILYPAFLCTAPCKGNKLLYSTRGAQRVEEDESSLLDFQLLFHSIHRNAVYGIMD